MESKGTNYKTQTQMYVIIWYLTKMPKMHTNIFKKWCWENWMFMCRRINLDPYTSFCTKSTPTRSKTSLWTPKHWDCQRTICSVLHSIGSGKDFLSRTHLSSIKANDWQIGPHETPKLLYGRGHHHLTKLQATEWENNFTNYTSDRRLISKKI